MLSNYTVCIGSCCVHEQQNGSKDNEVVLTLAGKYNTILLRNSLVKTLNVSLTEYAVEESEQVLVQQVKKYFDALLLSDGVDSAQDHLLAIGISCLSVFIQSNWTGPIHATKSAAFDSSQALLDKSKLFFSRFGTVYSLVENLHLLVFAVVIFYNNRDLIFDKVIRTFWTVNCLSLLSQLVDDETSLLFECVANVEDEFFQSVETDSDMATSDSLCRNVMTQIYATLANFYHSKHHTNRGNRYVEKVKDLSNITFALTGKLGKRTRYQEKPVAQPFIEFSAKGTNDPSDLCEWDGSIDREQLTRNILLSDDTVLDEISYTDGGDSGRRDLSAVDQLLLLSVCAALWSSQPSDPLLTEELEPYVRSVLTQPRYWALHNMGLLQRCRLEKGNRRKLERCLMQLQELVDGYSLSEVIPDQRRPYLCASGLPPRWVIEKELADFNLALGLSSTALDIYIRLELWESVVFCYKALNRHGKAEEVILAQLEEQETPLFYCLLADIRDDPELYLKAWELSGKKSGRAMKTLGFYQLRKNQYAEAVESFENALKISSLDVSVWFSLGCAAMAIGKYELCIKAFKRCVMLDADQFEAWNNLANGYVRTNNKRKAFLALQEAIKCNYENWMVWENYLILAVDCGEFDEVVRAYHRLLDLKDKYLDTQVLQLLVSHITSTLEERENTGGNLIGKVRELFGRITSKVSNNGDIWRCYARLTSVSDGGDEKWDRVVNMLQKSHRAHMSNISAWISDEGKCVEQVELALELSAMYVKVAGLTEDARVKQRQLTSDRLMLKSLLTHIEKHYTDASSGEILTNKVKLHVEKIKDEMNEVLKMLDTNSYTDI